MSQSETKTMPEAVEISREEKLKITEYDEAARVTHLYLEDFCDESLPYPAMVADAAREAKKAYSALKAECERLKNDNRFLRDECYDYESKITALVAENEQLWNVYEAVEEYLGVGRKYLCKDSPLNVAMTNVDKAIAKIKKKEST